MSILKAVPRLVIDLEGTTRPPDDWLDAHTRLEIWILRPLELPPQGAVVREIGGKLFAFRKSREAYHGQEERERAAEAQ